MKNIRRIDDSKLLAALRKHMLRARRAVDEMDAVYGELKRRLDMGSAASCGNCAADAPCDLHDPPDDALPSDRIVP